MKTVGASAPVAAGQSVEAWEAAGSRFSWRGHKIFYRDEGDGEPLLLIHGMPTASWVWHRVWPLLLPHHRLIAPDLAGFGLSDKPRPLVADITAQAQMCQALLTRLGVTRYRVLAGDLGVTVAQELLARGGYPVLTSLCLTNGAIFPEAHRAPFGQRLTASRLGRPLARLTWRGAFGRGLRRMSGRGTRPDRQTVDALWSLLTRDGGRELLPVMMGLQAARRRNRERWVGAIERARLPCRFVCGMADPVAGREMAAAWRDRVPGRDVVELEGIGHWPELEGPQALAEAVLAFHGPEEIRPAAGAPAPAGSRHESASPIDEAGMSPPKAAASDGVQTRLTEPENPPPLADAADDRPANARDAATPPQPVGTGARPPKTDDADSSRPGIGDEGQTTPQPAETGRQPAESARTIASQPTADAPRRTPSKGTDLKGKPSGLH